MFEERIAAMNQRTEESIVASTGQFDKRTYTVDEIQDILGISRTSAYNLVKKKLWLLFDRVYVTELLARDEFATGAYMLGAEDRETMLR